jgi:predicted NAD/FAD-binding protein
MRVAVVGSGIAGLAAAYWLAPIHDVSVFEAEDRIGGHAHSVTVRDGGDAFPVDTGFLVFNDRTYPILTALFDRLGVRGRLSDMSFSVRDERDRLEYGGGSWNALFAQRTNLVRPSFHALLREILRFHRFARGFLQEERADVPLAEFLRAGSFSDRLRRCYLVPMTAAIWSAAPASVAAFPTTALLRFFEQHGLLETGNYPRWFTVEGASRAYLDALTRRASGGGPRRDRHGRGRPRAFRSRRSRPP